MDVKSFKGPLRKLKFYRLVAHTKKKTYNQWRILGTKHSTLVPYEKELPYFPRKKRASVIIKERPTKFKDSQLIISKKKKDSQLIFTRPKKKKSSLTAVIYCVYQLQLGLLQIWFMQAQFQQKNFYCLRNFAIIEPKD